MKAEGYDEFMLASTFDYLMGDENVARAFLVVLVGQLLQKSWSLEFAYYRYVVRY
jgi:hypothetical protein